MEDNKLKQYLAILSFISSIIVGFIALFLPPQGIIDASVLWWVAQLLVFTATLLGINLSIDSLRKKVTNICDNKAQ